MKPRFRLAALVLALALPGSSAGAAEPLKKLAGRLQKSLAGRPAVKLAVMGFGYHDGGVSSGSTVVQERLTTFLVEGGAEVVERGLLAKVLEEMKLGASGALDPKSTKALGKVLGVGAIVAGTLNDLPKGRVEVNARVIDVETGRILSAGKAELERTWTDSPARPGSPPETPPAGQTGTSPAAPPSGAFLGKPLVQLALLLDTSNSMDGLIQQAKTQLWKIVNALSSSEKGGGSPVVQVALYEYGNDDIAPGENFVRQVLPFTADLDAVSEKLFGLKTNGGKEFCGAALRDAVDALAWDKHADVYKAVFIAGNEPFTQGPVDFREAAAAASSKGIVVNTIFCGGRQEGVATQWKAGAEAGSGEYSNIDQQAQAAVIQAPQDDEITRLGATMNETFVPVGNRGRASLEMAKGQDLKAASVRGMMAERSVFKASEQYAASASWDAAAAVSGGQMKVEDIRREDLPEELRKLDKVQLKDYLQGKLEERRKIQKRIQELNAERQKYIAQKQTEVAQKGDKTLDEAILGAVRSQASKKGFRFK